MSLVQAVAAMAARMTELHLQLVAQQQVQVGSLNAAAPGKPPCYESRDDFVTAFKPLFEWAFGNIRGIAPWIAAGLVLVIGVMILIKTIGRDDTSVWLKAVGWVFVGLAVILFVPTVVFAVSSSAPSGC